MLPKQIQHRNQLRSASRSVLAKGMNFMRYKYGCVKGEHLQLHGVNARLAAQHADPNGTRFVTSRAGRFGAGVGPGEGDLCRQHQSNSS